jgi:hypothetical protein
MYFKLECFYIRKIHFYTSFVSENGLSKQCQYVFHFNNVDNILNKLLVRYFKPLVYKEKALSRKRQGFIIFRPSCKRSLQARDENNKARSHPPFGGWQGFFFGLLPKEEREERSDEQSSLIFLTLPPTPSLKQ